MKPMRFFAVCVSGCLAVTALADLKVTGFGYGMAAGGSRGGEFLVNVNAPVYDVITAQWLTIPSSFRTFCLEKTETLSVPSPWYDIELSGAALYNNILNNSDPVSGKTAYLFCQYWNGGLTIDSDEDGAAFQNAIWYIENEITNPHDGFVGNAAVTGRIDYYLGLVAAIQDNDPIGNVRAINMWDDGGYGQFGSRRQDLLVCIPAPAAVVLGMLGIGLVGWAKRRVR
ncbi:MAG: hypothetical protein AB1716_17660 [Planctomycetota bacterium]